MNIIICADNNYILPCRVMLTSLCMHNEEHMTIYLFHSDMTEENQELIRKTVDQYGHVLKPCQVEEEMFEGAPLLPYISKTTYYRLLCTELLPESEERALYLDLDILVLDSVSEFYHSDLEGKQIIGVRDRGADDAYIAGLGIEPPWHFINAGVMLLNLKLMREKMKFSELMGLIADPNVKLEYADQDLINIYFQKDIRYGADRYNEFTLISSVHDGYFNQFHPSSHPCILHFAGPQKPWQQDYDGFYFLLYDWYLLKVADRREYRFRRLRYLRNMKTIWKKVMEEIRRRASE